MLFVISKQWPVPSCPGQRKPVPSCPGQSNLARAAWDWLAVALAGEKASSSSWLPVMLFVISKQWPVPGCPGQSKPVPSCPGQSKLQNCYANAKATICPAQAKASPFSRSHSPKRSVIPGHNKLLGTGSCLAEAQHEA